MKHAMTFLALAVAVALSSSATLAATVTFRLYIDENGPGTFNLYASDTLDNFGIAAYGVPLTGGITAVDHKSPRATDLDDFQPVGFTLLRSADNTFNPIRASQDTVSPTPHLVRGFGQTAGSLLLAPGVVGPLVGSEQVGYGAELLLASGSWLGSIPGFNTASPDLGANVFTSASGIAVTGAQLNLIVTQVPEPGSFVLAGCAGVGLLVARRRGVRRRR